MGLQAKQRLVATAPPDLSTLRLDRWFDRTTRNWVVQLKDADDNQVGDAIYVGDAGTAKSIKKDHPSFNLRDMDAENEARYGMGRKK